MVTTVTVLIAVVFCSIATEAQLTSNDGAAPNSILPLTFPATVLAGEEQGCPSGNGWDRARASILQEERSMIQNTVLPQTCRPNLGLNQENPAASCKQISECKSTASSGNYWLKSGNGSAVQMFCSMARRCCNSTGGWARVAYLNMTDPTHQCPSVWREITQPKRTCRRNNQSLSGGGGCSTARFTTNGITYSHVCGRITAYQFASPDAFGPYANTNERSGTIYDPYVDGVVVTHGDPWSHIWTFSGAHSQNKTGISVCPCTNANNPDNSRIVIPPWVGNDYFCETGVNDGRVAALGTFYPDDPLWDGENCGLTSTCCEFNNPPWFCKKLDSVSVSSIRVSTCGNAGVNSDDTPIELIEIYVQ